MLSHQSRGDHGSRCYFWQPAAVELLCGLAETMGPAVTGLLPTIEGAKWLLLPVNDRFASTANEVNSGSHWSTLVVQYDAGRAVDSIVHYDSLRPVNHFASQRVFNSLVQAGLVAGQTGTVLRQDAEMQLQRNASDCGVYPIFFAAMLANDDDGDAMSALSDDVIAQRVASLRSRLHHWLHRWAAVPRNEQRHWRDLTDVQAAIGPGPFPQSC